MRLCRAVFQAKLDDERSDDEGEEQDEQESQKDGPIRANGTVKRAQRVRKDS